MDDVVRVRFSNDLWWTQIPIERAIKWETFEVSYIDNETCFVKIDGTAVEFHRKDYDLILDKKAFRVKFGLKKHTFKF